MTASTRSAPSPSRYHNAAAQIGAGWPPPAGGLPATGAARRGPGFKTISLAQDFRNGATRRPAARLTHAVRTRPYTRRQVSPIERD